MVEYSSQEIQLPLASRSDEVHIAAERYSWLSLLSELHAQAPKEACTFVLTRPSIGVSRTTCILGEPVWPLPGDVTATPRKLEISANYISRALDVAIDAGPMVGLCLIHTHPHSEWGEGIAHFSERDDWYERRLFPTIVMSRPRAISASVVLGSGGDVDARIWWHETNGRPVTQAAHAIRIVGPELSMIETPASPWADHPDPMVMDRSTRLWGREGRRRLQNLRIGVVGGGGTGSLTIFALATMGIGKLRVWDKDTIEKENRHRIAAITKNLVGSPKVEALRAFANAISTAEPFTFEAHQEWGTTESALCQLKDCDVIFCCVDKFAPRVPLNDLAYAHLIPVIDMASWIHADRNKQVDALMTHAHVWSPGIPCAWCRETLTPYGLMREAQGRQQGIETRVPYGIPLEDTEGIEPSVLPLNMLGVSLALMEFLQVALRITSRTPNDLKFLLPQWELDESDRNVQEDCCCRMSLGAGDTLQIRPVVTD